MNKIKEFFYKIYIGSSKQDSLTIHEYKNKVCFQITQGGFPGGALHLDSLEITKLQNCLLEIQNKLKDE